MKIYGLSYYNFPSPHFLVSLTYKSHYHNVWTISYVYTIINALKRQNCRFLKRSAINTSLCMPSAGPAYYILYHPSLKHYIIYGLNQIYVLYSQWSKCFFFFYYVCMKSKIWYCKSGPITTNRAGIFSVEYWFNLFR